MKVSNQFKQLSFSELSNLSIGSDGSGNIAEKHIPKMISHTNEALLALYKKYILKEKSLILVQVDWIINYHLKRKYAESSGSDAKVHYIKDLPAEPFEEDVIKILTVEDQTGRPRVLNDTENVNSLFTPNPDTLQVPHPVKGQALGIVYQARHYILEDSGESVLNQDIDLPFFLETALRSYVAHLVYSNMNGQEHLLKSQEYLAKYMTECAEVDTNDLVNSTFSTSHTKLEYRGFV